jgi:hypothetical protein
MITKIDNRTGNKLDSRSKIMIKKMLYASLETLGLISILIGMMAVYKETGLHDLWLEFITKLIS